MRPHADPRPRGLRRRFAPFALLLLALPTARAQEPADAKAAAAAAAAAMTPEQALDELRSKRDDAEVQLIQKVANVGTRKAAQDVAQLYDAMTTLLMRREIVKALTSLADSKEGAEPAMQKLANIAGNDDDPDLRERAIEGLGRSAQFGKELLKQIVDSSLEDHVRELALKQHRKLAGAADTDWYRYIWNLKQEQRKNPDGGIQAPELPNIREAAFAQLAGNLSEEDLVETLRREQDTKIRRAALQSMRDRNLPKTNEMAEWVLDRVDFQGAERIAAARLLVARQGAKAVPALLALAKKRDVTQEDLRAEIATLIADLHDEASDKKVAALLGKGKTHEKVFALLAAGGNKDPKVQATIRKSLREKEEEVRRAAASVLARNRDRDALPDLRDMLQKPKLPFDRSIAIGAIGAIEGATSKWLTELGTLATDEDAEVRNAAVEQIAKSKDKRSLPVLLAALEHADWTTRLLALEGLEQLRDKQAVPKLIDRLEHESGRMLHRVEDALWRMTGQPWDEVAAWRRWWGEAGEKFEVLTEAEFDKVAHARELQRLKQRTRTKAQFFGIKVESTRVIFILDISGSMLEPMYGRKIGKRPAARIDVAKQELTQAVQNLDPAAEFNILVFNNGVAPWRKDMAKNTEADRQEALVWIERLGASGGTNLYDSLQIAFADKDVDTIYVMSDGEPNVGGEIDPYRIRADVATWNDHRKVVINTIAVGGNFEILEWLAQDSGGKHVQIR
jgi:hypothetical protein